MHDGKCEPEKCRTMAIMITYCTWRYLVAGLRFKFSELSTHPTSGGNVSTCGAARRRCRAATQCTATHSMRCKRTLEREICTLPKLLYLTPTDRIKLEFHGTSFRSMLLATSCARMSRGCYGENGPVEFKL